MLHYHCQSSIEMVILIIVLAHFSTVTGVRQSDLMVHEGDRHLQLLGNEW
jgi:hypothetical protein